MQVYQPPEKKCKVVIEGKSDFKEKKKKQMKKSKKKKKDQKKLDDEKEKQRLADEKVIKSDDQQIFECYTNTITPNIDKGFEKRKRIKNLLTNEDKEKIEIENGIDDLEDKFLCKEEIVDLRRNYNDLSMGDYVIVFPNPDEMNEDSKSINYEEALRIYNKGLEVRTDDNLMSKKEYDRLEDNFTRVFASLKNFATREAEYEERNKNKKISKNIQKEQEKNIINNNNVKIDKLEGGGDLPKNSSKEKLIKKEPDALNLKGKVSEDMDKLIQAQSPEKKDTINLTEFQNLDVTNKDKIYKYKKRLNYGGFLTKETIPDSNDVDWICSNEPPQDFLTLVRNTIMTKLTRNANMHVRSFLTSSGKNIVLVIKADEKMVMREAELSLMDKQIELGGCDIFSLEPVDSKCRPLRIKPYLRKPEFPPDMEEMPDIEKEDRENGISVSSRAQSLFQKIMKMTDLQLQRLLVNKQAKLDPILVKLANSLDMDLNNHQDILEDVTHVDREVWETYYIYLAYLEELLTKIEKEKKNGIKEISQNLYFLNKLIFLKSVGDANEISYLFHKSWCLSCLGLESDSKKKRLVTLWDLLGTSPIPPYMKYCQNNGENNIWRSYEKNERGERSNFLSMERLKMVHKIISKHLNIISLIKDKMIVSYFPLHDIYQMDGEFNAPLFMKLYDKKFLQEFNETPGQKRVRQYFVMMADEAEKTDFDTDGTSLTDDVEFNWSKPWEISVEALRNYFGEKIAMYFNFLSFYTLYLLPLAFLGVIAQIVIDYASLMVSNGMKMAFSFLIIIWSTIFIEFWKRKESLFAVQYGQTDAEETEAERPSFKGKYIRSIHNDDINVLYYSKFKKSLKLMFAYFITLLILTSVVTIVILLLYFKEYLYSCGCIDMTNALLATIPSLLNAVQVQIFNFIYQFVGLSLNEFENHKYLSMYENSLIFKLFGFTFINTFNSLIILSFMSSLVPSLNICKTSSGSVDCFEAVAVQMKTLFLTAFCMNIPELLLPYVSILRAQHSKKKNDKPIDHPFYLIDQQIEDQIDKTPYAANLEVDGTVGDYMELITQFGFLCLFSVNFPCSFLLAFITDIAEIQVDKLKIMRFKRRPIPENAKGLGTWLTILDFLSFLSIFFNAALIAYSSSCIYKQDSTTKNKVFVLFVLFFLGIKYIIKMAISDVPAKTKLVERRHGFIKKRVDLGIYGGDTRKYKPAKIQLAIEGLANTNTIQEEFNAEKRKTLKNLKLIKQEDGGESVVDGGKKVNTNEIVIEMQKKNA